MHSLFSILRQAGNVADKLLRRKFLYFAAGVVLLVIIAHDYNKALSERNQIVSPAKGDNLRKTEKIVNLALSYQDVSYAYAGKTPEGFDCSGFTFYVYKKFGIHIPGSSRAQYGYGKSVVPDEVQKGDLVFFTTPSDDSAIGHVGIVISEKGSEPSYFIHSSSGKADGVTIDSLTHPYYAARLVGARRVASVE